ncbi:MAG: BadF/BadG/BcrA/BcrD ATPase family protein [Actinoplanes sp.]
MTDVVLGFDVGGTGTRAALASLTPGPPSLTPGPPSLPGRPEPIAYAGRALGLRRGPGGVDGAAVAASVAALAGELLAGRDVRVAAAAVGCAGAADLGDDLREHLPAALDAPVVVVCSDLLTAFLGALDATPGVTLAVGTGVVAVGADLAGEWRRADGWGDVVGDAGGGAWLGRAGLTAALRAHDGRRGGSAALLEELAMAYGEPRTLIRELSGRDDRAGFLAGFAPAVLRRARAGDEVARAIRDEACQHLADTAAAARPRGLADGPVPLATTGALLEHHPEFRAGVLALLEPGYEPRPAAGTACDGALRLAAAGSLPRGAERFGAVCYVREAR